MGICCGVKKCLFFFFFKKKKKIRPPATLLDYPSSLLSKVLFYWNEKAFSKSKLDLILFILNKKFIAQTPSFLKEKWGWRKGWGGWTFSKLAKSGRGLNFFNKERDWKKEVGWCNMGGNKENLQDIFNFFKGNPNFQGILN